MRVVINRVSFHRQGIRRGENGAVGKDVVDGVTSIKRLPDFEPNPREFTIEMKTKFGIVNIPADDIIDLYIELPECE